MKIEELKKLLEDLRKLANGNEDANRPPGTLLLTFKSRQNLLNGVMPIIEQSIANPEDELKLFASLKFVLRQTNDFVEKQVQKKREKRGE